MTQELKQFLNKEGVRKLIEADDYCKIISTLTGWSNGEGLGIAVELIALLIECGVDPDTLNLTERNIDMYFRKWLGTMNLHCSYLRTFSRTVLTQMGYYKVTIHYVLVNNDRPHFGNITVEIRKQEEHDWYTYSPDDSFLTEDACNDIINQVKNSFKNKN